MLNHGKTHSLIAAGRTHPGTSTNWPCQALPWLPGLWSWHNNLKLQLWLQHFQISGSSSSFSIFKFLAPALALPPPFIMLSSSSCFGSNFSQHIYNYVNVNVNIIIIDKSVEIVSASLRPYLAGSILGIIASTSHDSSSYFS